MIHVHTHLYTNLRMHRRKQKKQRVGLIQEVLLKARSNMHDNDKHYEILMGYAPCIVTTAHITLSLGSLISTLLESEDSIQLGTMFYWVGLWIN